MKIDEAIQIVLDTHEWFRPIDWVLTGQALTIHEGYRIAVVPSATGGRTWYPNVDDFTCGWEVVDPNTVLDEVL
jgi:hypothetical protein